MTARAERTLPSNLEAERAVLGTVLVTHGRVLDTVADQLTAAQFYPRGAPAHLQRDARVVRARGGDRLGHAARGARHDRRPRGGGRPGLHHLAG